MDYTRQFGGFIRSEAFADAADSFGDMAVAVNQFFLNGGTDAFVVALTNSQIPQTGATVSFGSIVFTALEITDETYQMTVTVRPTAGTLSPPQDELADVIITYGPKAGKGSVTETYRRVSANPLEADGVTPNPNFIETRIGTQDNPISQLVTVSAGSPPGLLPAAAETQTFAVLLSASAASTIFQASDFVSVLQQDAPLDKLPIFNIMVIPGVAETLVLSEALAFCEAKRAFYVMDPPIADSADGTTHGFPHRIQDTANDVALPRSKNGALYFPYLKSPDPITGDANNPVTGQPNEMPPAATVAGLYAATDVARGVWKAPAGFQTTARNALGVVDRGRMTDPRQGVLNPLGVNCLRDFPNIGTAVFGARTLVTVSDEQWRYVPVRRMALFLEQTFYANLKWVVFEPNAEPLWTAITMSINAFMLGLFRQNAFKGDTPSKAFQVLCNSQTTTPADIDNGIVNIVVAFAPLKPAEFVVITIAQLAGQTQST